MLPQAVRNILDGSVFERAGFAYTDRGIFVMLTLPVAYASHVPKYTTRSELSRRSVDADVECARSLEDARALHGRLFGLNVAVRLSLDINLHVRPSLDEQSGRALTSKESKFGLSGILHHC